MNRQAAMLCLILFLLASCRHFGARSSKCFDDIRDMVKGKTAVEVSHILGQPDTREQMLTSAERWVWWDYTYLDGENYPPEMRGRVVHLEIIFERTGNAIGHATSPLSEWRTAEPLGISYTLPPESK